MTIVCAALVCSLLPTRTTWADPIGYSVGGVGLTQIDLDTGIFSTIGPEDVIFVAGATIGFDGHMYAVGELNDELWRIDLASASRTLIGGVGVEVDAESGLAFDACGVLWMVTNRRLYRLDPTTGQAVLAHDLSHRIFALTAAGEELLGLVDMDPNNQLVRINPETGALTPVGDVVLLPTQRQGLDFDSDGRLWGLFWIDSPIPEPTISSIVEYDPTNGAAETTGWRQEGRRSHLSTSVAKDPGTYFGTYFEAGILLTSVVLRETEGAA